MKTEEKRKLRISNPFFISVFLLVFIYLVLKFGIHPPIPSSLITMYMGIIIFAIILYVSSSESTFQGFLHPIILFLTLDRHKVPRTVLGMLIPLILAFWSYQKVLPKYEPPAGLRTIHPAPPDEISVKDEKIVLSEAYNPFRGNEIEKYKKEGRKIYFSKCMPCHGDNLDGKGHWAKRINPIPINFRDPGTIAMMPESFIFWRVAKGGMGLPDEGAPWDSAMPVWEHDLSVDEIWKVVLFIYEETGFKPKKWE